MIGLPHKSRATSQVFALLLTFNLLAASPAAAEIDETFKKSLAAASHSLERFGRIDDPQTNRRVQDIGYLVATASKYQEYPLTFHLIDMPEPNAFALPGGQIFITRGMLALDLTDDELAALLGHEIAHVALKHGTRMQRRAALLSGLSMAALVGVAATAGRNDSEQRHPGEIYGGNNSGDLIQGTAMAGAAVTELLVRDYSRGFEDESDLEGQRWAAGAGFDPAGARLMMAKLGAAIPQDQTYGYWRTHPFNDLRVRNAEARANQLKAQPSQDPSELRRETQRQLLGAVDQIETPELRKFLEDSAVNAWPKGVAVDGILLARLHSKREALMEQDPLSRNYTALVTTYQNAAQEVLQDDPESTLPETLRQEVKEIEGSSAEARQDFFDIYQAGVMQTETLEALLANFPDFDDRAAARLQLADRYARLERQPEAVAQYLLVIEAEPESEQAAGARRALAVLVKAVDDLCALELLRTQQADSAAADLARETLAAKAKSFHDLETGAAYLKCAPTGTMISLVRDRLEVLAQSRLAEVLLYQRIGNAASAVAGIDDILTHAPWTEAANRLRQQQREAAGISDNPAP